jgi:hypothetical protein
LLLLFLLDCCVINRILVFLLDFFLVIDLDGVCSGDDSLNENKHQARHNLHSHVLLEKVAACFGTFKQLELIDCHVIIRAEAVHCDRDEQEGLSSVQFITWLLDLVQGEDASEVIPTGETRLRF